MIQLNTTEDGVMEEEVRLEKVEAPEGQWSSETRVRALCVLVVTFIFVFLVNGPRPSGRFSVCWRLVLMLLAGARRLS